MEAAERGSTEGNLAKIRAYEIERNPQNPRILFDPIPMATLKESIEEVGILNPILAYAKREIDQKRPKVKYVILDGERRWLCAQQIEKERTEKGLKDGVAVDIPANIVPEPTTLQNILMMFHIHEVREPWELTPTALKLEVVMRFLRGKSPSKITELTGLAPKRVKDCLILLSFSKNYLDMSLREKPGQRITGDFFVEMYPVLELIKERYPRLYKKYKRDGIIGRFVEKYEAKEIRRVTEFRDFANLIRAQDVGASYSEKIVEGLIATDESIRSAYKREAEDYWKADKVRLRVDGLTRSLERLELSNISRRAPVFTSLRKLRSTLDKILESHK